MYDKVLAARERLKGQAHLTPVMTSRTLNERVGAEVFLKCENYQRVGAFKFRGAYNAISQLSDDQKARGVLTFSSGNHGQATALVCKLLGISAVVVMPTDASAAKRAAVEGYGASVQLLDPATGSRQELAERLSAEHGYTIVPPFDDEEIVAGQGTATLELYDEVGTLDLLLAPVGGGGLISGTAIASKGRMPSCKVMGVEPELANDAQQSFHSRRLVSIPHSYTIADGTRTPSLGPKVTFPAILKYVDGICAVSEAAIIEAVQFLFYRMKLVVEPSGALGVAALLSGAAQARGRVGVILSGGNIDAATMTMILNSP